MLLPEVDVQEHTCRCVCPERWAYGYIDFLQRLLLGGMDCLLRMLGRGTLACVPPCVPHFCHNLVRPVLQVC